MSTAAPSPTYETVEPLINRSRVNGNTMEYVFRCPATGFEATGTAPIVMASHAPVAGMGEMTLKSVLDPGIGFEARTAADKVIPFSGTIAGFARSARRIGRSVKDNKEALAGSPAAQQQGVQQLALTAFDSVASQFAWDGTRWVKAGI